MSAAAGLAPNARSSRSARTPHRWRRVAAVSLRAQMPPGALRNRCRGGTVAPRHHRDRARAQEGGVSRGAYDAFEVPRLSALGSNASDHNLALSPREIQTTNFVPVGNQFGRFVRSSTAWSLDRTLAAPQVCGRSRGGALRDRAGVRGALGEGGGHTRRVRHFSRLTLSETQDCLVRANCKGGHSSHNETAPTRRHRCGVRADRELSRVRC